MGMGHPWWPLFDLRVRTPRLELRLGTDDDLLRLVEAARLGIHPPEVRPFNVPWSHAPSPDLERSVLSYNWRCRGNWTKDEWELILVAETVDGSIIGCQSIGGKNFSIRKEVLTGSWIAMPWQGQGYGKEMRAAILHLAFVHLEAQWATSTANSDNAQSLGVSLANGYEHDGIAVSDDNGKVRVQHRFRLTRERWEAHRLNGEVTVDGFEQCRPMFGA